MFVFSIYKLFLLNLKYLKTSKHMKKYLFRKLFIGLSLCIINLCLYGQNHNPRLVVRADDMGAFHSVNTACIEACKNGIGMSVEVMTVTPWFPEAVKLLNENYLIDVGIHLTITSEWENIKWRPLTNCPSLTDTNGYFLPMMYPNPAYPGKSIIENKWNLNELENEFRAQIELGLKNLHQVSHLSGHMGAIRFNDNVLEMVKRLADEYNLTFVEGENLQQKYNVLSVGYNGSNKTAEDKKESFIRMIEKLESGKNYIFLDHPALDTDEMKAVAHIGYEWVAEDRQGVTDLFTNQEIYRIIKEKNIELINYNELTKSLPRSTPEKESVSEKGISDYLNAVKQSGQELHSLMVLRHGKVIAEHWFDEHTPHTPHVMFSVSKTFAATAIGFAVSENRLKVSDKVISFFPDQLPDKISTNLQKLEIKHLLTMSVGHDVEVVREMINKEGSDWIRAFLSAPLDESPGTEFAYNSYATFMLSAIIQKITGERLTDYLYPRLFRPLGIIGVKWESNSQGIDVGGWGLYIKTEDMAKMGQFFLQKGKWNGKQLLPESWFNEATTSQVASLPAGVKRKDLKIKPADSDWLQGYGYQMWRCRHNAYRADGANGQYIIIIPEKDAVIVTTANIQDMQAEINLIWKHLLPALQEETKN